MGVNSKKKGSKKQKENEETDIMMNETRFAAAETHPQFRPLKPKESKVVLDERFSSVLTDPRFQLEGRDKYGRKGKKSKANKNKHATSAKEELSSFYMVEEKEDDEADMKKEKRNEEVSSSEGSGSDDSDSDSDSSKEEKEETKEDPASRIAYLTALSRGELDESSSSDDDDSSRSSDDDDEEEEEEEDPVYGNAGILDPSKQQDEEIEISYDTSPYLVVQNMDWEHIRAVDLFSLLSSFTTMGAIQRVQVFQSDFGKERMEKDRLQGPTNIWKKGKTSNPTNKIAEEQPDSDEESSSSEKDNSSQDDYSDDDESAMEEQPLLNDNDFDPEKLRAYEASKLKYYFAIVEFTSAEYADVAYREVDGMEFERSSAAIDLRTLPQEAYEQVVQGRRMRDEATSIPGNYDPPEFVVSALQQTSVECTWDQGDVERERKLTQYNSGGWQNMTEADDLQAYLASDGSSDDDSDDEQREQKSSAMRKLLGLDSGSEGSGDNSSDDSDDDSDSDDNGMSKEIKYIPGQKDLEEKIRSKLKEKDQPKEELTPWQKYQEKRKQKRRERRQAARGRRNETEERKPQPDESDNESVSSGGADNDDFLMGSDDDKPKKNKKKQTKSKRDKSQGASKSQSANTAELELLLAGDNDEEQEKDFDIRGLQRIEKNKGKKLKGGRKRKEEKITKDVSGINFKVDVKDNRFAAVLDGSDGKFGIDKTDPNYKDTAAMRDILAEQTKRRKKKRKTKASPSSTPSPAPDVSADSSTKTIGSNALSSLVQRLKTKVANQ